MTDVIFQFLHDTKGLPISIPVGLWFAWKIFLQGPQHRIGDHEATDALTAAQARIAELEAERDALSEYAKDATVTITNLTAGGSEFFAGKLPGGMYKADLKRCAEYIREVRRRDHQRWLTSHESGRVQGLDEAAALAAKDSETLPSNCSCRHGKAQGDICSRATARNLKSAIESLKTKGK